MKKSKINLKQKLFLKKEIVAQLEDSEAIHIVGGGTLFSKPCGSCGGVSNCCPHQTHPLMMICVSNNGPTRCDCIGG